jgi:rhodanese-related sulfurtransferase
MLKTIPEVIAQARASLNIVTAAQAIEQFKANNALILDVREPDEFAQKSAAGAINIPRGLLEMKMLQMYPDSELAIFIHCATGVRSTFAGEQLQRVGYQNVSVITCDLDNVCSVFC